jgi:thioesterase domain-containing protein
MSDFPDAALHGLQTRLLAMPPARALQLRVAGYDQGRLRLHAPLAANVNDKGSAFGGSLASLMTLAAWGLTAMRVEHAGLDADVYVADTQLRYLAPLHADLEAEAWLEEGGSWDTFIATLRGRGRARACLEARVLLPDGNVAARATSRYAAILKR